MMGRGIQLLVVMRTGSAGYSVRSFFPATALIRRAVNASFTTQQFYGSVKNIWFLWRNRQANFAYICIRQTLGEFFPAISTVAGAVDARTRTAAQVGCYCAVALPGSCV